MRTAGLKKTFSKPDTTNWSYDIYEITEINSDSLLSHRLDKLPERINEALLKEKKLTLKENNSVVKTNIT